MYLRWAVGVPQVAQVAFWHYSCSGTQVVVELGWCGEMYLRWLR